jgi:hypothetical protein
MVRGFNQGFGRGVAGFAGGAQAEQAGFDAAMGRETRLAQALAQIRASDANADRDSALAAEARRKTDALAQRPDLFEEQAALAANVDLPTLRAVRRSVATGQAPQVELPGPATPEGGTLMGTLDVAPEVRSRIGQALMRFVPLQANTGDIAPDNWAQALGRFREQDLGDDVLAGRRTAGAVGASQAAIAGKPLFNSDASGAVLDVFGGRLSTDNPMAGATINLRNQQAGQARAAAAENFAQAAKARAEAADGANGGGMKAPTGYRWNAAGTSLEYIPGGPADPTTKGAKLAKPPTEGQAKALMFASRMAIADEALGELEKAGTKRPGAIKGTAETLGNILGLGTDSMGGALADVAGTLTNWTQSEEQQQVEQAQRDFINAVLRRESGAVISLGEFRNAAKQYFPQPSDDAATLRQKAANRRAAIAGMKAEFGEPFAPDFERIVKEARQARRPAGPREGGATGSWDDAPGAPAAPRGWSIERER